MPYYPRPRVQWAFWGEDMLQNRCFFYREEAEYSDQLALLSGTLTDTTAAEHQTKINKW